MRDRKRKMPDRKSAVFDQAILFPLTGGCSEGLGAFRFFFKKSFSFRKQKLSYVRSKNRLGFNCGVSDMPTVGIIKNLNTRVLTPLPLELFRVQLLLYNCAGWMSTQNVCNSLLYRSGNNIVCCLLFVQHLVYNNIYIHFFSWTYVQPAKNAVLLY